MSLRTLPRRWSRPSRTRGLKPAGLLTVQTCRVASFTDAWIETGLSLPDFAEEESRPSRTRGLKLAVNVLNPDVCAGRSRPSRTRGLKLPVDFQLTRHRGSRPSRTRGLKHRLSRSCSLCLWVASFTDAWIETRITPLQERKTCVASFTDAWIETCILTLLSGGHWSRPSRTRGLKHAGWRAQLGGVRRVLHGRVD